MRQTPYPSPEPGVLLADYLESVGAVKHWLPWQWIWEQDIRANSQLPQPRRFGLVVERPLHYGCGESVYALPIDARKEEVILEDVKGHRRALEKLADLDCLDDQISFAMLTVMASLVDYRVVHDVVPRPRATEFELLLAALWAYFGVRNLWHRATRRYTFTGFAAPYSWDYDVSDAEVLRGIELLRHWVVMRWSLWCSEVGIGYLVDANGRPLSRDVGVYKQYPEGVMKQINSRYRLNVETYMPKLERLSDI